MQSSALKPLTEKYSLAQLQQAEEQLLEGIKPDIEIEGSDEGEQLTHVSAAIWILEDMNKNGIDFRTSLRNFMSKVRNSIS